MKLDMKALARGDDATALTGSLETARAGRDEAVFGQSYQANGGEKPDNIAGGTGTDFTKRGVMYDKPPGQPFSNSGVMYDKPPFQNFSKSGVMYDKPPMDR